MKLSPTATLALALAAGMAGAAVAQTSATSGSESTSPQTTAPAQAAAPMPAGSTTSPGQSSYAQPQQQMQPSFGQAQTPNNANEQVRMAQQQLRAGGLYNGPVDGVMDPDTRAALARFQQQNGLQQTQSLDQQTLARLMNQPAGSEPSAPAAAPAAPSGSSGSAAAPAGAGGTPPGQANPPGQAMQR